MSTLTDNQAAILQEIGNAGTNYRRAKPKTPVFAQLASRGFVEYNPYDVDEDGKHPYRVTPAGQAYLDGMATKATAPTPRENKNMNDTPTFALASVAVPTIARGEAGKSIYPFADLKVDGPNSFFIPTGDKKNPSKSFGSIVSNQNKHAGFKKFTLRTIADGAPWGHAGARGVAVFILHDEAPAEGEGDE